MEAAMHGLAGIEDAERTPLSHWSVMMFQTIPPSFFCRSVVAIVMQGALFDWGGWMDDMSDSGQPQRLRLTPSWWYKPAPLLWIDDLGIPKVFQTCGQPNFRNGRHALVNQYKGVDVLDIP